ncbi:hypothetical protein AVEN_49840-1 [Araneus ventricosus]|uniref:RNase H type-1 domain-containing protein n=1 Tax=Araneus ventricosus TaxID=182803 RepID=A0A4Y2J5V8_ARAVE|nr:hypothetical protein AVEN_49840-1 [Araneus ventricosus]
MALLGNSRIRLGWVKTHIGIKGNETANTQAMEATRNGTPTNLLSPKKTSNYLLEKPNYSSSPSRAGKSSGIMERIARVVYNVIPKTSNKQQHWSRECIQLATGHGPFPSYLKRFGLHPTDY